MLIMIALLFLGLLMVIALGCTCAVGQMLADSRQTAEVVIQEAIERPERRGWHFGRTVPDGH